MRFCALFSSSEIDHRPPTDQRSEIRSQRSVLIRNPQSGILLLLALCSKLRAPSSVPLAAARATSRWLVLPLLFLGSLAPSSALRAPSSLPFALSRISKRRQSRRLAPLPRARKVR